MSIRLKKMKAIVVALFGGDSACAPGFAWFAEGHGIVAIIAADDLTPTASQRRLCKKQTSPFRTHPQECNAAVFKAAPWNAN
jgi:hypothetical protein